MNFFSFLTGSVFLVDFALVFFITAGIFAIKLNLSQSKFPRLFQSKRFKSCFRVIFCIPSYHLVTLTFEPIFLLTDLRIRLTTFIEISQFPTMDTVSNVTVGPLPSDSPYMKPFRFFFTQNGKEKNWGE